MNPTILLAAFVLVAVLAQLYGTDSRDGRDWQPRRRGEHW